MYDICITFSRSKDFEQEDVETVIYTNAEGIEITVSGEKLLTHHFPISSDLGVLLVQSPQKTSSVSWKDIRAISFSVPDEL